MQPADILTLAQIHRQAFGPEEGEDIAPLVEALLALPDTVSIHAYRDDHLVGNLLFTPFKFHDHPTAQCYLLGPNAVAPAYQGRGVGRELMEDGLKHLSAMGVDAIFVLGVPDFYPKFGFSPTDKETPYPHLLTLPAAWMVRELNTGSVAALNGRTTAVTPFMHARYWDMSPHA